LHIGIKQVLNDHKDIAVFVIILLIAVGA